MVRKRYLLRASLVFSVAMLGPAAGNAGDTEELPPYKMLRSMQFVQDSVALGDHSAAEMQRFMLGRIDERLRAADPSVFEDQRNVDAALIYAMSGGNPATLEYLVARDVDGHFDNRITDALRKYFSGKGTLVAKTLSDMVPEYKDTKIGPYLALVSANTILPAHPEMALKFYDWARLSAPGTIVEEAALRRSVSIAATMDEPGKGLGYASRYVRRFLHSPYASQFTDLFVALAVDHYGEVGGDRINEILAFMDSERQREVYLRIARRATIAGKSELARLAAVRAQELSKDGVTGTQTLANLYDGVATISTADVGDAIERIAGIPENTLSARDRALRAAAKAVAEEILREPDADSLAKDMSSNTATEARDNVELIPANRAEATNPSGPEPRTHAGEMQAAAGGDTGFETFMTTGRSKLDAIDSLLSKENAP